MYQIKFKHQCNFSDNLNFLVSVSSGRFSGETSFCVRKEDLEIFISELSNMHRELKGECSLADYDSDDYIHIEVNRIGHVLINGQVGGSHREQFLHFSMKSDQTILSWIASELKSYLTGM